MSHVANTTNSTSRDKRGDGIHDMRKEQRNQRVGESKDSSLIEVFGTWGGRPGYRPVLEELLEALGGYAASERKVLNAAIGFNDELTNSKDENGHFYRGCFISSLSQGEFNELRRAAEETGPFWGGKRYEDAHKVLSGVLAADREEGLAGTSCAHWWCGPSHLRDLILCTRFISKQARYAYDQKGYAMSADSMMSELYQDCWDMYGQVALAPNPLVWLRQADSDGVTVHMGEEERCQMLADLENLSTRLWCMASAVDLDDLVARLALQPDSGARDVATLRLYGRALGFCGVDDRIVEAKGSEREAGHQSWQPQVNLT